MRKWMSHQAHNLKIVGSNPTPALSLKKSTFISMSKSNLNEKAKSFGIHRIQVCSSIYMMNSLEILHGELFQTVTRCCIKKEKDKRLGMKQFFQKLDLPVFVKKTRTPISISEKKITIFFSYSIGFFVCFF